MDKKDSISRIAGGAPWEPIFGYSRAVKAGDWLAVSGTTSFDNNGQVVGYGQMYVQARQAIANISAVLERAGATLGDVVPTRVFATDLTRFAEIARAHRESFGAAPPASTAVEVRRLVHPDMLVEIEADVYAPSATAGVTATPPTQVARRKMKAAASGSRAAKPRTARPRRQPRPSG